MTEKEGFLIIRLDMTQNDDTSAWLLQRHIIGGATAEAAKPESLSVSHSAAHHTTLRKRKKKERDIRSGGHGAARTLH